MSLKSFSLMAPVYKDMALAFTGFALWTVGDALVKALGHYPPAQIGFVMSVFNVALMLIFAPKLGGMRQTFTMPKLGWRLARGAVLAIESFFSIVAFSNLDLATAYSLVFAMPLMAKLLSVLLLGERIRLRSWAITLLGFAGILIVLRPGVIPLNIGTVSALLLAFFFALGYVMGRKIGAENQTLLSTTLFQCAILLVVTALPAWHDYVPMEWHDYVRIFVISAGAVTGSLMVASAFNHASAATIAPIHYTQMIWGLIWGAVFFGEYPDGWTMVGGGIVIIAGLLLIFCTRTYKDDT